MTERRRGPGCFLRQRRLRVVRNQPPTWGADPMRLALGSKTPMALVLGMALLWACSADDPVTPSNNPPEGLAASASGRTGNTLTWNVATGVHQQRMGAAPW